MRFLGYWDTYKTAFQNLDRLLENIPAREIKFQVWSIAVDKGVQRESKNAFLTTRYLSEYNLPHDGVEVEMGAPIRTAYYKAEETY